MDFLNTYTQAADTFDNVIYGIILGVFMIILLVGEIVFCYYKKEFGGSEAIVMIFTAILGGLGFLIASAAYENTQKIYTYHQVTISDEVTFDEVYEKYEIIKQEGKIFTIREKEIENE